MSNTVTEIRPRDLDPMIRTANRGLMVMFINRNLLGRADLDVRHSIVFYDEHRMFEAAVATLPEAATLQALYERTAVRYWSRGM